MGIDRLGKKRTRRTRTWAAVCAGLFGERGRTTGGTPDATPDADGSEEAT